MEVGDYDRGESELEQGPRDEGNKGAREQGSK
jgi:hypothetical protein